MTNIMGKFSEDIFYLGKSKYTGRRV